MDKLVELAERVRRLQAERRGAVRRCASGLAELDAALGGGFVLGAVHEFVAGSPAVAADSLALHVAACASRSMWRRLPAGGGAGRVPVVRDAVAVGTKLRTLRSGSRRLAHRLEAGATLSEMHPAAARADKWLLYVDVHGDFYPPAAARLGVALERLLVVRAHGAADVQWVCEQALRCRAIAAVIAALPRLDGLASRRLQLAAEAGGGLGLLLRDGTGRGHTFAASRLRLDPLPTAGGMRRVRVSVLKLREGRSAEPFALELPVGGEFAHSRKVAARRQVSAG